MRSLSAPRPWGLLLFRCFERSGFRNRPGFAGPWKATGFRNAREVVAKGPNTAYGRPARNAQAIRTKGLNQRIGPEPLIRRNNSRLRDFEGWMGLGAGMKRAE